MPVLVNKSRRAVVISSVGVAVPPGKSVRVRVVNPEITKLVDKGILAPVEALGVAEPAPAQEPPVAPEPAPDPSPEPVVVPEPAPEPVVVPEPAPEPEVGAEPRRRGRPAKSEA